MILKRNSFGLKRMDILQKLMPTDYLSVRKLQIKCLASFEISMSSGNCSEFLWSIIFPEKANTIKERNYLDCNCTLLLLQSNTNHTKKERTDFVIHKLFDCWYHWWLKKDGIVNEACCKWKFKLSTTPTKPFPQVSATLTSPKLQKCFSR